MTASNEKARKGSQKTQPNNSVVYSLHADVNGAAEVQWDNKTSAL